MAFARMHSIGKTTLSEIVRELKHPSQVVALVMPTPFRPTLLKKDRIIAFLRYLQHSKYVEPVPGSCKFNFKNDTLGNPENVSLTFFHDKESVFRFFMLGVEDGIPGEFEGMVKLNFESPPSINYFKKLWESDFPFLLTESDRPQCTECFKYDKEAKEALRSNDTVLHASILAAKRSHKLTASQISTLSKDIEARSRIYPEVRSFVVDNMSSKTIPKRFKETSRSFITSFRWYIL